MKKTALTWITLGMLAVAAPVMAQDSDVASRPYVSAMGTWALSDVVRTDHNRQSKNGFGGYLGGGFALSQHFGLEIGGMYSTYAPNGASPRGSWFEYGGELQGLYFLSRNPHFAPYLLAGVGGVRNVSRLTAEQNTSLLTDGGIGAMSFFHIGSFPIGLRVDARYRWIDINPDKFAKFNAANGKIGKLAEPILSVGFVIPLGGGKQETPPPPPPPAPMAEQSAPPPAPTESPNRKFEDVHFAFDKSNLSDYAKASLDGDAQSIGKLSKDYPKLKVDVAGHTDWIGTEAYNQALSERRANAVKDYLEAKGVDGGRIETFAYGESKPIAPNTTAEGRALNRRAEIRTHNP